MFPSSLLALVLVVTRPEACGGTPLHWLWSAADNDSAYTIDPQRAAEMVRNKGYADMGPIAVVDVDASRRARPLRCFYAAAPRTDTFCSTSRVEHRLVRSLGFVETGIEGFVFSERAPGRIPLFRLSRPWGDGRDREHRFAASTAELERLRHEGWSYDGAKGFVCPLP